MGLITSRQFNILEQILDKLNIFTSELIAVRQETNELSRKILDIEVQLAYHIDTTLPYKCINKL